MLYLCVIVLLCIMYRLGVIHGDNMSVVYNYCITETACCAVRLRWASVIIRYYCKTILQQCHVKGHMIVDSVYWGRSVLTQSFSV